MNRTHNAKLDEIEAVEPSRKALDRIVEMSRDPHYEIRMRAAEKLGEFSRSLRIKARLLELLSDSDPLVRIAAIESLECYLDPDVVLRIRELLADKDPLVRGYAALALGETGNASLAETLRARLEEAEPGESVCILSALIRLGHHGLLRDLLEMLRERDYRVRCAVANLLCDLLDVLEKQQRNDVLEALKRAQRMEMTKAALSSIRAALSELERP